MRFLVFLILKIASCAVAAKDSLTLHEIDSLVIGIDQKIAKGQFVKKNAKIMMRTDNAEAVYYLLNEKVQKVEVISAGELKEEYYFFKENLCLFRLTAKNLQSVFDHSIYSTGRNCLRLVAGEWLSINCMPLQFSVETLLTNLPD